MYIDTHAHAHARSLARARAHIHTAKHTPPRFRCRTVRPWLNDFHSGSFSFMTPDSILKNPMSWGHKLGSHTPPLPSHQSVSALPPISIPPQEIPRKKPTPFGLPPDTQWTQQATVEMAMATPAGLNYNSERTRQTDPTKDPAQPLGDPRYFRRYPQGGGGGTGVVERPYRLWASVG